MKSLKKIKTIFNVRESACDWKRKLSSALFLCFLILNCFFYINYAKGKETFVVLIDPGHGGNDPGKVSADGVNEKDLNLEIAKRLKAELQARGVRVVMTREIDCSLADEGTQNRKNSDLRRRVELAEENKVDYLVSIHQNSYENASVCGPQVFYCSSSKESEELAELIQKNIVKKLQPEKIREAKAGDDYYILRKSSCPAVIVECGFLSAPKELEMLQNANYQQQLARVLAQTICDYLKR